MIEQVTNFDFKTLCSTLDQSVRASKLPMSVNPLKPTPEITPTVEKLGLSQPGTGHNNFLSGIIVQFDLTATLKFWPEWERYHFQQIISSQSTMHKICQMNLYDSCDEKTTVTSIENLRHLVEMYKENPSPDLYETVLMNIPTGLKLTARVSTNYLQLKTMYAQRHNHRLSEWRNLCAWMETLPMSEWITGGINDRLSENENIDGEN